MTDRRESIACPHAQSEINSSRRYVAYYRVSTGRQGRFGFSVEGQRAAVNDYVANNPGVVVAELSETMSGRRNDRPALSKALSLCRIARATLVIARLDRLSRNVEMIARLMESGLEFVAADFPHANRFTIHILAAVAEYEVAPELRADERGYCREARARREDRITRLQRHPALSSRLPEGERDRQENPLGSPCAGPGTTCVEGCRRGQVHERHRRRVQRERHCASGTRALVEKFNLANCEADRRRVWTKAGSGQEARDRAEQGPKARRRDQPASVGVVARWKDLSRDCSRVQAARRQLAVGRRLGARVNPALSDARTERLHASSGSRESDVSAQPVIAYYRVSTRQQARSGLGLLAQQDAVRRYVAANRCKVLAELTEVESGRDSGRPKLAEALWFCRVYDAKLVIARLDRLARSTAMIAGLMKSGVDFVAADMPLANCFTIHILAAVAEYEARLISERTKAAFAAAKARGRKFGNPDPSTHRFSDAARKAQVRAIREKAKTRALDYLPLLCELRDRGETIHGIALQLTAMGIETPRRRMIWRDRMVA